MAFAILWEGQVPHFLDPRDDRFKKRIAVVVVADVVEFEKLIAGVGHKERGTVVRQGAYSYEEREADSLNWQGSAARRRGASANYRKVIRSCFVPNEHGAQPSRPRKAAQAKKSRKRDDFTLDSRVSDLLRKRLSVSSYGKLAEEIGITKGMLERYAKGRQSMTLSTLRKIQKGLGVSLSDIFGEDA